MRFLDRYFPTFVFNSSIHCFRKSPTIFRDIVNNTTVKFSVHVSDPSNGLRNHPWCQSVSGSSMCNALIDKGSFVCFNVLLVYLFSFIVRFPILEGRNVYYPLFECQFYTFAFLNNLLNVNLERKVLNVSKPTTISCRED